MSKMELREQQRKLLFKIAETDMAYNTWNQSYEDCREAFHRFAETQPEEIRNMLHGYADRGRLAQQRLVNLACENMIFPSE